MDEEETLELPEEFAAKYGDALNQVARALEAMVGEGASEDFRVFVQALTAMLGAAENHMPAVPKSGLELWRDYGKMDEEE